MPDRFPVPVYRRENNKIIWEGEEGPKTATDPYRVPLKGKPELNLSSVSMLSSNPEVALPNCFMRGAGSIHECCPLVNV